MRDQPQFRVVRVFGNRQAAREWLNKAARSPGAKVGIERLCVTGYDMLNMREVVIGCFAVTGHHDLDKLRGQEVHRFEEDSSFQPFEGWEHFKNASLRPYHE